MPFLKGAGAWTFRTYEILIIEKSTVQPTNRQISYISREHYRQGTISDDALRWRQKCIWPISTIPPYKRDLYESYVKFLWTSYRTPSYGTRSLNMIDLWRSFFKFLIAATFECTGEPEPHESPTQLRTVARLPQSSPWEPFCGHSSSSLSSAITRMRQLDEGFKVRW